MKCRAFIVLGGGIAVCCCFVASSVQAIDCLSAPNHSESGWWSWREIDGRKCWYKKVGAVPAKSEFRWPEHEKEAQLTEATTQQESSPSMQPTEVMAATSPQIEMVRVKPVEIREPGYRLGDGLVGLFEGLDLSGHRGIGNIWELPAHIKLPVDTFEARYGEWSDR
jgi:hypothetical protein